MSTDTCYNSVPEAERFPLLAMDKEAAATRDDLPPVEDAPAVARGGHRLRWRRRRLCWPSSSAWCC